MKSTLGVILTICFTVVADKDTHVEYERTGSCSVSDIISLAS